MFATATTQATTATRSKLGRALALFTDVRAGEGTTAVLMLVNAAARSVRRRPVPGAGQWMQSGSPSPIGTRRK